MVWLRPAFAIHLQGRPLAMVRVELKPALKATWRDYLLAMQRFVLGHTAAGFFSQPAVGTVVAPVKHAIPERYINVINRVIVICKLCQIVQFANTCIQIDRMHL